MQLNQARTYALSLPGATEEPHFHFTSFRVRGKTFATSTPGEINLHIFVDEDLRAPLIAAQPESYEALRWG
jgi:predicted DNA-binding protein (MmcQ/YjbR family)